jgi:hypothetical protein
MTLDLHYHIKKVIYKNSQLLRDNRTSIKNFFNREKLYKHSNLYSLTGGSDLIITYKYTQINDEDYYILYSKDDFDCASVIIDRENKVGEIHGIGNFKSCLSETYTKVGSILLNITIKMLKNIKTNLELIK